MSEEPLSGDDEAAAHIRRRVSLREVARTAGVALSSASRALSGHPDVSEGTRERVHTAARELGYEPNLVWESLRRGSTRTVGLVVRDISSPLFAEIALEADVALREAGYSLLVSSSMGEPELDVRHIRLLNQRRVDGLMLSPTDTSDPETLATLERLPIPFVAVDRDLPEALGGSAVLIDQRSAMLAAVRHLLDLGHRLIGFVSPPAASRPAYEATQALVDACTERGARWHLEPGAFAAEHGEAATRRMLESDDPPTAIIAGNNQIFPGTLTALRAAAVDVPRDLSLITLDELPLLTFLDPPVSSVSRRPREVGRTAAQLMLERLAGKPPRTVVTPTHFTPRGSCGPPPTPVRSARGAGTRD